jgi:signal transduction histidine kinase
MRRIVLLALLILKVTFPLFGQSNIHLPLPQASSDRNRLATYKQLYERYQHSDIDTALAFTRQGIEEFDRKAYKPGQAALYEMLGSAYNSMGKIPEAREAYSKALTLYKELKDSYGIASINNGIGVIEGKTGNFNIAARYFINALQAFESLSDTDGIVSTYIKLGMVNDLTGNPEKSMDYYQKGLALSKRRARLENVITLHNNIGGLYIRRNDLSKALEYFKTALKLTAPPQYARLRVLPLINIGNIHSQQGDHAEAIRGYREAEAIAIKEHMPVDQVRLAINISRLIQERDADSAQRYLSRALSLTREMGNKNMETEVLEALIDLNSQEKKFALVAELQQRLMALKDTLYSIEKEKEIASLESLHELNATNKQVNDLKAKEEARAALQKTFVVIMILFAIIAILLTGFTLKTRRMAKLIVERKRELQKANDIKDRLFSVIGHDLKGPMNNIPVLLGFYREAPEDERQFIIDAIEESAVASAATLDTLLNWGKLQIMGITYNPIEFKLANVVDGMIKFLRLPAAGKNITIVNNVPTYISARADIDHIRFVVRNLLSNAVKFTRSNGIIEVSASLQPRDNTLLCSVKDSGIGIPPDKIPYLFDQFDKSTPGTADEAGNGLGLMLVKEFILQNGGDIWVESSVGEGSTFMFTLPASIST